MPFGHVCCWGLLQRHTPVGRQLGESFDAAASVAAEPAPGCN